MARRSKAAKVVEDAVVEQTKPVSIQATIPAVTNKEPEVISVVDSVTVTISIPSDLVASLIKTHGSKMKTTSITAIINNLIKDGASK